MTLAERADAPIYASLVEEHGDVIREARRFAEQAQREVSEVMDFSRMGSLPGGGPAPR